MIRPFLAVVTLVLLSSVAATVQAQAPAQAKLEWTGVSEERKTEPFTPPTGAWRVTYKTTGERFGLMDIYVRTKDDTLIAAAVGVQGNDKGVIEGSFQVKSDQREVILHVVSVGLQWQLAVEPVK